MKVWLTIFIVLFAIAEFYLWIKQFIVPLPVYIVGGAFLAIASNYEKGIAGGFLRQSKAKFNESESLENRSYFQSPSSTPLNSPSTTTVPSPNRPISFTIERKELQGED
ncbi:MAG: hypothetical protein ACOC3E_02600 [Cyanobacteriota bacterium]